MNQSDIENGNDQFSASRISNRREFKRSHSASNFSEKRQELNSTAKSNQTNYGQKLYEEGIRRREEKMHHIMRAKSEQERAEFEHVSFHPEINPRSKQMKRRGQEKAEDNLI